MPIPESTTNTFSKYSLRSRRVLSAVLVAGAAVCALVMFGLYAAVAAPLSAEPDIRVAAAPFAWTAVVAWLALAALALWAHWLGRNDDLRLGALAAKLSSEGPSPGAWTEPATESEEHLFFLAEHLAAARLEREDARLLGRTLLQVGAQYTLLCTLDGRLLEANPAFLARTGLSPDEPREQRDERLARILHLPPLLDLARRSLQDETAITGIQYQMTVGDQRRPIEIALRALSLRSGPAVVIVMTDKSHAAELERQIDQFTDALDLMVDQRLARITAGRSSIEETLSGAGVAIFVFDRYGKTESINRAAELLTGRTRFTLAHVDDVVCLLAPYAPSARRIGEWFAGTESASLVEEVALADGRRRALLLSGADRTGGEVTRRVLAVIPAPEALVAAGPAAGPAPQEPAAVPPAGTPLQRLEALAAALDPHDFAPVSRTYVDVIREAVRRLDAGATGGDGVAANPASVAD